MDADDVLLSILEKNTFIFIIAVARDRGSNLV